jgi:hypothetical protein
MKYAAEIGSGAMIYIPSLMKIGNSKTQRQHGELISLLLFFSK